jgi:hypothetical protein
MKPKGSLLCSQQPVSCSYPVSDETLRILGLQKYFDLILSNMTQTFDSCNQVKVREEAIKVW